MSKPSVFHTIKSIQKIDRKILPHAEKNLLVSIVLHLGENGNIWPSNETLGKWIGESKDYAKNLLMRLKNKGFIKIEGRGKNRVIFGNRELPEESNRELPVGNRELPREILPIILKDKEKTNNVVVVSSCENYGLKFDGELAGEVEAWIVEAVGTDPDKQYRKLIDLFEYTAERATSNPNGFIRAIVTSGGDIPRVKLSRPKAPVKMPEIKPEEIKPKTIDGQAKALGYKIPKKIRTGIPLQFFIDALEQYDFFKLEGIIYDLVGISTPDDFFSNLKGRVLNA